MLDVHARLLDACRAPESMQARDSLGLSKCISPYGALKVKGILISVIQLCCASRLEVGRPQCCAHSTSQRLHMNFRLQTDVYLHTHEVRSLYNLGIKRRKNLKRWGTLGKEMSEKM